MRAVRSPKTAVSAALRKLDADPVGELVALARDADTDPKVLAVRAKVWCELLQYCHPKLRSIEIEMSGGKDRPVQLAFDWDVLLRPSGD